MTAVTEPSLDVALAATYKKSISEHYKDLALKLQVALNTQDLSLVDGLIHDDFLDVTGPPGMFPDGPEGVRQHILWLNRRFKDAKWEVQQAVAEGTTVVLRVRFTGIETEEGQAAPVGTRFTYAQAHYFEGRDGLLVQHIGVRSEQDISQ
ncbi:ester cyclase [Lentzea sp. BCCO 10_0856]|uniref:Ester cyclase n=1 Tax=Lentzea miocenica TaxID=3095431 RepID=A0ABU4SUH3_9PSEU|nr:ester cyclase [Lentzea sp. BCCO 10_0856]MDX8029442.1 ester cyclase [Lentzea sp. BCCO 10_0856]